MGNLSFIVPTQNVQDFNKHKIQELLTKNIPDGQFEMGDQWNHIDIYKKDDDHTKVGAIATLYFKQDCYVLNYDKDIKALREMEMSELALNLKKLQQLKPDLDNIIQMTHALSPNQPIKRDAEIFLHKYFKAYIFDEGIHPEYIPPDYVYKKLKKLKFPCI